MSLDLAKAGQGIAYHLASQVGLPKLSRFVNRKRTLILMYHAVVDGDRPYQRGTHITSTEFASQLRFLKAHFHLIPLPYLLDCMVNRRALPPNSAVVTFDDGYENNYLTAFPILRALKVPATVFLATGSVDTGRPNWPDRLFLALREAEAGELDLSGEGLGYHRFITNAERDAIADYVTTRVKRMSAADKNRILDQIEQQLSTTRNRLSFARDFAPMSWEQVNEMAASGLVHFGAHTVNHEILSRLPQEQMRREIIESYHVVCDRLGVDSVAFAYPNGQLGDFTEQSKAAVREVGALCALSAIPGLCNADDDLYELQRIGVGPGITTAAFVAACSGLNYNVVNDNLRRLLGRT